MSRDIGCTTCGTLIEPWGKGWRHRSRQRGARHVAIAPAGESERVARARADAERVQARAREARDCAPDCRERETCDKVGALGHGMCGHCPACDRPRHHCGHLVAA